MKIPVSLVCGALLIAIPGLAQAAPAAKAPTGAKVVSVGSDNITIQTMTHGGSKVTNIDSNGKSTQKAPSNIITYKVNSFTEITVDGLKSSLGDVKPGMRVNLGIGIDPSVAASIAASSVSAGVKPSPAAKGKKGAAPPHAPVMLGEDRILSLSGDRLTVGNARSQRPRAYILTPHTVVKLDGRVRDINVVHVGMGIRVTADSGGVASEIDLHEVR